MGCEGQVANRPVYAAVGVTLEGRKDVLGLWAGTGGEGAKFWMSVLVDLKNRGVRDAFFGRRERLAVGGRAWRQSGSGLPAVARRSWPGSGRFDGWAGRYVVSSEATFRAR
ncbi:hypothetical protein BJ964_006626 [Actinoplanes lobatus]|uniref:Mutator family transposase n=1 Tax=Actinoplanes lobatus TaxID=113568 RepID=A0A7W7HKZ5_9ACTN|nr:hypothetical protein [Actinoplanes lobatus]